MNKRFLLYITPLILAAAPIHYTFSAQPTIEAYEHKKVATIKVKMENLPAGVPFNSTQVLSKLNTKVGDPFSQITFDQDLKTLSEEYDRAEPSIEMKNGEIHITIRIWQKPIIRHIKFVHKKFKTHTLERELGIEPNSVFNRDDFNKAFNKLKEFYIKKGFFEAELQYTLVPVPNKNEMDVVIKIQEGRAGHVTKLSFEGFSMLEESEILEMIHTKKYNLLTSWLTGKGIYHEEALEHDKLIIVDYLQNQGYADAKVSITTKDLAEGIQIVIKANRGQVFHFGDISFSGNTLFTDEEVKKVFVIHSQGVYSPDRLRKTIQEIKDLYGKKGYIETDVQYTLQLAHAEPTYNVHFQIEENEQFKVGMVRVLGNSQTNTSVILHESLLVPGQVFDSRRLKATQQRLEAIGYFKSVNVYAVRSSEDLELGTNYRDVIIEVDETTTGNASLFFGFSSVDSIYGGFDLTESNFNYKGLRKFWRSISALRGGGEYAHARASWGARESAYSISWMTPYCRDSLWRVGFDTTYSNSRLQSKDYTIHNLGFALYANYPLTPYFSHGWKFRINNAIIDIKKSAGLEAREQQKNSGLVSGITGSLSYDSTDNSFKPHRGLRSIFESEIAGIRRHDAFQRMFPFLRFAFINNYYYPVWRKGTFKTRFDLKYIYPFGGNGNFQNVPLSERFFLGGDSSVRGYKPLKIGPKFIKDGKPQPNEPTGGISSFLFSLEYLQNIYKPVDAFVFFDSGSISDKIFDFAKIRMSAGVGLRLEVAARAPIIVGYGFPFHAGNEPLRRFFFAMGGQF
jgi:outer membrane protein insertion porin family